MKSRPLNEFTREELETALAKYLGEEVSGTAKCRWCHQAFTKNRRWQEFCTVKCKGAFHKHEKDLAIEALQGRVAFLSRDLDLYKRLWSRVPAEWRQLIEKEET